MNIGRTMCRIVWKDDFFPETEGYSIASDGLLAIASVAGFELEGYLVTRPDAAEEIAPLEENDLFRQIVEREGVKKQAEADWPQYDLSDWQTLCGGICESGKPVLLYLEKRPSWRLSRRRMSRACCWTNSRKMETGGGRCTAFPMKR